MSKYSELAERLDGAANGSPDGADAELFNEATEALRELEAENRMYSESLANATQEIERLRHAVVRAIWLLESEALDADHKALGCLLEARAALEGRG